MSRQLSILFLLVLIITGFSLKNSTPYSPSQEVKNFYLNKVEIFKTESGILYKLLKKGNEKQIQQQFLKQDMPISKSKFL